MKQGDLYNHFKGTEYQFKCIALPLNTVENKEVLKFIGNVRYHEDDKDIKIYQHNGIWVADYELPLVIYQSELNYGTNEYWAREVDDFFGYKINNGKYIKRFILKK